MEVVTIFFILGMIAGIPFRMRLIQIGGEHIGRKLTKVDYLKFARRQYTRIMWSSSGMVGLALFLAMLLAVFTYGEVGWLIVLIFMILPVLFVKHLWTDCKRTAIRGAELIDYGYSTNQKPYVHNLPPTDGLLKKLSNPFPNEPTKG